MPSLFYFITGKQSEGQGIQPDNALAHYAKDWQDVCR
jgi:hypothetical protein